MEFDKVKKLKFERKINQETRQYGPFLCEVVGCDHVGPDVRTQNAISDQYHYVCIEHWWEATDDAIGAHEWAAMSE